MTLSASTMPKALGRVFLELAQASEYLLGAFARCWCQCFEFLIVPGKFVLLRRQHHRDPVAQLREHRSRDVTLVVQDERGLGLKHWHFRVPGAGDLPVLAGAGRHGLLAKDLPELPVAEVIHVPPSLQVPAVQEALAFEVCQLRARLVVRLAGQREEGREATAIRRDRSLAQRGHRHEQSLACLRKVGDNAVFGKDRQS